MKSNISWTLKNDYKNESHNQQTEEGMNSDSPISEVGSEDLGVSQDSKGEARDRPDRAGAWGSGGSATQGSVRKEFGERQPGVMKTILPSSPQHYSRAKQALFRVENMKE